MQQLSKRHLRNIILALTDVVIVVLSAFAALSLRFDFFGENSEIQYYTSNALACFVFYGIGTVLAMFFFRLYNRVWTYASQKELVDIIKATVIIEAIILMSHVLMEKSMPRSYYLLHFIVMTILILASRFSVSFIKNIKNGRKTEKITNYVMVVGAGSAASILISDFEKQKGQSKIICAIDDNPNKRNKYLRGVPIVGNRNEIEKNARKFNIHEIIIAMPAAKHEDLKEIIRLCQETGLPVRILPSVSRSLSSSIIQELRPVNYEDLLGRDPIRVDQKGIKEFLQGKTVLVTGGGGSIGSELCRQITIYEPKKLVIFDIYENNAYEIEMELKRHFPEANVSVLIGSVRDLDRLESVFIKYKPDVVFHAAAHKHVPLMEKSPNEAIKNNCLGTLNAVKLADKYNVEDFVLISTDKAVRPTNIMGASKYICERIVQIYARKSETTRYSGVRFGNVLGSNGSVIPLFLKQIEEGGPVTVTHKEIRRFFMTIAEAVTLVLQASLYAKGGEIFVLDMGEPVNIYNLAETLIRMKGFRPNEDIDIEIVGLRPGEKLYEEVCMEEEGLEKTANNMIYVGKPVEIDDDKFLAQLDGLIEEAQKNGNKIKELTEEICDTYTITDN